MGSEQARIEKLESIALPVCAAHGVELVQIRHLRQPGGAVVQVIIDRERPDLEEGKLGSGVSLTDCTSVSRDLGAALDVEEDVIPGNYRLEVSSPGVERPLVKLSDFERFAGHEAKVVCSAPVGDRRRFTGVLKGIAEDKVQIECEGVAHAVPHGLITKAHLVYRF